MKSLAQYFPDFFLSTKAGLWIPKKDHVGESIFKLSSPLQMLAALSRLIINRNGDNEDNKLSADVNNINHILLPLSMEGGIYTYHIYIHTHIERERAPR